MNYTSTRGNSSQVTAAEAIRLGIAPDGGLFAPVSIPEISHSDLIRLMPKTYQQLAAEILALYLTDYKPEELAKMVDAAYASPARFDHPHVTPVVKLRGEQHVLELWHGPTAAFKDLALQLLPFLMTRANAMTGNPTEIVILVATSGDTGKAALEGFRDIPATKIVVFFPNEGVSQIQRLQMVTQEGYNTHVAAVKGNFDDAQNGVKQIFTDPVITSKLKAKNMTFSSANSINWGRLAPQIVYYFYGYLELCRRGEIQLGSKLNVVVPTGNFGNILAAYFAKRMGLPLAKLICASNSNNVLADFINTGIYDRNRKFYTTISPSMDILISSNLERLLYYLSGENSGMVNDWMAKLKTEGRYQVTGSTLEKLKEMFYGGYANEADTSVTIKRVFEETKVVLDPHTAVGVSVYERYRAATGDDTPVLFAATASPFKFNSSVIKAITGETGEDEFSLLQKLKVLSGMEIPAGLKNLDQKPVRHATVCEKEGMAEVIYKMLKLA